MEEDKYKAIKLLAEGKSSVKRTALRLGMSTRNVNRLLARYKVEGKSAFSHKNKLNKHAKKLNSTMTLKIVDNFLKFEYNSMSVTQYTEHLQKDFGIKLSIETVRKILIDHNVFTTNSHRKTLRIIKRRLQEKVDKGSRISSKDASTIRSLEVINHANAHPTRSRVKYSGELIQLDASLENWFGIGIKSALHLGIDDATGIVTGGIFRPQETLDGYYEVFNQTITNYGIPAKLLTDNRTVFSYHRNNPDRLKNKFNVDEPTTQFGFIAANLGVELQTTSIPHVKGRIERLVQSFQKRLTGELRLRHIRDIFEANRYLPTFIAEYNERFSLKMKSSDSVFDKSDYTEAQLKMMLAFRVQRVVDAGNTILFKNKRYITVDESNSRVLVEGGTRGILIKTTDDELFFNVGDKTYALVELPVNSKYSNEFDREYVVEVKTHYIPLITHPWRQDAFEKYLKQKKKLSRIQEVLKT
jgi:transposase